MNVLKKLLLPKELKKVLETLNLVEINILVFITVKEWVAQAIWDDRKKMLHFIKEKKIKPMDMVFLLISDYAGSYLGTGRFHIRRGRLTDRGKDLLEVYTIANEKLVASGYLTREAANIDYSLVKEGINSAG